MRANIPKPQSGDMQGMLRKAQKMQEDMANLTAELETREYEVAVGGGACSIKINGKREISAIEISPEIVDPDDIETLQDILTAAVNEAIKKVDEDASSSMAAITDGAGLPSFPGLM
jgi:DNA-binding YbaB/EbfC family protein